MILEYEKEIATVLKRFICLDCGVNTHPLTEDGINEYYMVYDYIWPIGKQDGMLCIDCLEKRIGRKLVPGDFTKAPVNAGFNKSERLLDRLGRRLDIYSEKC